MKLPKDVELWAKYANKIICTSEYYDLTKDYNTKDFQYLLSFLAGYYGDNNSTKRMVK